MQLSDFRGKKSAWLRGPWWTSLEEHPQGHGWAGLGWATGGQEARDRLQDEFCIILVPNSGSLVPPPPIT